MAPAGNEPKTQGQMTMEHMAQQMQINAMSAVQLQLITFISARPPVSDWPVEVRKHIHSLLTKILQLFGPRTEEEATFYAEP